MAPIGVALFSKLASHTRPISENVWVYVPSLYTGSSRSTSPAAEAAGPQPSAMDLIQRQGLQLGSRGLSKRHTAVRLSEVQVRPLTHRPLHCYPRCNARMDAKFRTMSPMTFEALRPFHRHFSGVTDNSQAPDAYVIIAAIITLVVLLRTRETAFASLR